MLVEACENVGVHHFLKGMQEKQQSFMVSSQDPQTISEAVKAASYYEELAHMCDTTTHMAKPIRQLVAEMGPLLEEEYGVGGGVR